MVELLNTLLVFLVIFAAVFVLNVVPIFAPPTWAVLSFIAIACVERGLATKSLRRKGSQSLSLCGFVT